MHVRINVIGNDGNGSLFSWYTYKTCVCLFTWVKVVNIYDRNKEARILAVITFSMHADHAQIQTSNTFLLNLGTRANRESLVWSLFHRKTAFQVKSSQCYDFTAAEFIIIIVHLLF